MRENIHPKYVDCTVTCACGYTFKAKSTKPVIKLEMCSNCHPFFTGKQKLVDTAGRVERFAKKFAKTEGKTMRVKAAAKKKEHPRKPKGKVLSTSPRKKKAAEAKAGKEVKEVKK